MCYFSNAFRHPRITIDAICHALNDPKFDRIDFIVGTGISGLLLLVPVSLQSSIPCGAIRKPLDANSKYYNGGSHSGSNVEEYVPYNYCVNRYIIIDDLIDSGKTIERIIQMMIATFSHCRCAGIILYQNYNSTEDECGGWWNNIPLTCLHNDINELNRINSRGVC